MTGRQPKQTFSQKMLDPWKKRSGFKKGLLTDIVLGDEHVSKGHFETTMHADYGSKTVEQGGKIAGRFSGFLISDPTEKHINFGDVKLINSDDRKQSITKNAFLPPKMEPKGKRQIYFSLIKAVEKEGKSIRETYHAKLPTSTSTLTELILVSAHMGAQTRQDLPIDDNHFTLRNFNTTTNDAYRMIPDDFNKDRIIYGAKRSQLYFGDLGRKSNYDTVQSTSFVHHVTKPIELKKKEYGPSAIFNSQNYGNSSESQYTTTLSDAFKGEQTSSAQKAYKPIVSQKSGASHIQFGQSNYEPTQIASSVTKRDYVENHAPYKPARNAQTIEKTPGIQSAIQPNPTDLAFPGPYFNEIEGPLQLPSNIPPAGVTFSILQKAKNISSVPEGDTRFYNTGVTKSTSKEDFIKYSVAPRVVVNGQTEESVPTKSRIFNHDLAEGETQTVYETTSQTEYVKYSKEEAKMVRGQPYRPGSGSGAKISENSFPREMLTTQHAHFTAPVGIARRNPHLPQVSQSNRLFPLAAKSYPNAYQTSFSSYFPVREELFFGNEVKL
jgi:hypothetical protein